ncbi:MULTISPECIES: hypothetical protein [unclassified Sphingomonas]|uniref:hypothetical protein n=1 Tax=unclassified Sphingomonas TaxID=196159 RepID=UPI0006FF470B|nr:MULTISPECIES: hypothetical protein [unclassified Sphingomonas]KQX18437.1 hypothetical protein ASD17_14845 [Sphingomonas sp. Root1294]KQY72238.1 hypothetical protein ASD39_20130 [Sphingomonas sp. Root50]KRB94491.1 hypothetical protein ASE22_00620 [Sphingomonas sp. Root720]
MTTDRNWRPNPGTSDRPKDPNAMVWLRFRCGYEPGEPRRAGLYVWRHRGWDFDIMAAAEAD